MQEDSLSEIHLVKGVKLGVVKAGIRYPDRKDLVFMAFDQGTSCAGVFTQNKFCAAPVVVSKTHLNIRAEKQENDPFYFLVNTGNANAGTGATGLRDAKKTCESLAQLLSCQPEQVYPFSTGVIGEPLPMDRLLKGLPKVVEAALPDQWSSAAEGIMTTDTRPKVVSEKFQISGEDVCITGICKGAGMIRPDMATMLGFVATDARISQPLLQSMLFDAVAHSFNRVTIDGDTSTNDCCMLAATGKSNGPEITRQSAEFEQFQAVLNRVFVCLAQAIVRDGEGATKFVEIKVESAFNNTEALEVAYTVAHSPLVKTALFASDPNWGRILAAVGRAKVSDFDVNKVNISLNEVKIVENGGRASGYSEEQGQSAMNQKDICICIQLGRGKITESVWTSDLSHDYVSINADYRS
jgi:glutamate N-acetyltransferase/amino-acid N-acetyltransferase